MSEIIGWALLVVSLVLAVLMVRFAVQTVRDLRRWRQIDEAERYSAERSELRQMRRDIVRYFPQDATPSEWAERDCQHEWGGVDYRLCSTVASFRCDLCGFSETRRWGDSTPQDFRPEWRA